MLQILKYTTRATVHRNEVRFQGLDRSGGRCKNDYCKTLNVCVPFISRTSRAKQNCEIKGREYELQAKNCTKLLQYFELYVFNSPK